MSIPDLFASEGFRNATLFVSLCGLGIIILADQFQTLVKYKGALDGTIARGYNSAMKIMVGNRVGAVTFFLFMGFNIDTGAQPDTIAVLLALTLAVSLVPMIFIAIHARKWDQTPATASRPKPGFTGQRRLFGASLVASTFNNLGLTIPWIICAMYPDYRLTLVNISTLFNIVFTIINVFYIEHKFARMADLRAHEIHRFVNAVFVSRTVALTSTAVILLVISSNS